MTPEDVKALFTFGEMFVEETIAAALVILWVVVFALHVGRPYMVRSTGKFTLRLGADLWWIIYVGLRDILLVQVFLGSFIFFYPDVATMDALDLPITGGLAAACAFAVMVIKLMTRGDADVNGYRWQVILIGLGATLYIVPYMLGSQMTQLSGGVIDVVMPFLVAAKNPALAIPLTYISAAIVGLLGVVAVVYNLRQTGAGRPKAS
ncbi:MAG: hypothetical protein HYX54_10540 [Chloroflexi bacterium]|nr:hypothetical protein [Chloroflexota bacterium]